MDFSCRIPISLDYLLCHPRGMRIFGFPYAFSLIQIKDAHLACVAWPANYEDPLRWKNVILLDISYELCSNIPKKCMLSFLLFSFGWLVHPLSSIYGKMDRFLLWRILVGVCWFPYNDILEGFIRICFGVGFIWSGCFIALSSSTGARWAS